MHTSIAGRTPSFGEIEKFEVKNITEIFENGSPRSTFAISEQIIMVNGKTYKANVSRFIQYEPQIRPMFSKKQKLIYALGQTKYTPNEGLTFTIKSTIENMKGNKRNLIVETFIISITINLWTVLFHSSSAHQCKTEV